MQKNLEASGGLVYSQQVLLALIDRGMSREDAYRVVQEAAAATWDRAADFREEIGTGAGLTDRELEDLFRPRLEHLDGVFVRLEKLEVAST
jgi:adenylosuccinate lyase